MTTVFLFFVLQIYLIIHLENIPSHVHTCSYRCIQNLHMCICAASSFAESRKKLRLCLTTYSHVWFSLGVNDWGTRQDKNPKKPGPSHYRSFCATFWLYWNLFCRPYTQSSSCCLSSAGIKGIHYHCLTDSDMFKRIFLLSWGLISIKNKMCLKCKNLKLLSYCYIIVMIYDMVEEFKQSNSTMGKFKYIMYI